MIRNQCFPTAHEHSYLYRASGVLQASLQFVNTVELTAEPSVVFEALRDSQAWLEWFPDMTSAVWDAEPGAGVDRRAGPGASRGQAPPGAAPDALSLPGEAGGEAGEQQRRRDRRARAGLTVVTDQSSNTMHE